jgi:hypothetical protein
MKLHKDVPYILLASIVFLTALFVACYSLRSGQLRPLSLAVPRPNSTTETQSNSSPIPIADNILSDQKSGEVRLNEKLKKELDDYFSVFAQTKIKPFERGKVTDETLIGFALDRIIRYNELSERSSVCDGIDEKVVEAVVAKYFEAKIKQHKSAPSSESDYIREYRNGCYFPALADGASGTIVFRFSKATGLIGLGDGYYEASVNVYEGEDDNPSHVVLLNKMKAIIKQAKSSGDGKYILVSYQKL